MANDTNINITAHQPSNILVRVGGHVMQSVAKSDSMLETSGQGTELEQMQNLAPALPAGTVHPAPGEYAEVFHAPVYGSGLNMITEVGDPRQWVSLFFLSNCAAVLPGSVILGFIGGAVAAQGHADAGAGGGFTALGGVILGNIVVTIVGMVYRRSYNIMRQINALAFTRWLRLRHGIKVYPHALKPIMYQVNGEVTFGSLGKIIKDTEGRSVMLTDAKKGGISVSKSDAVNRNSKPAIEHKPQIESALEKDATVFTGNAAALYKQIFDAVNGLTGKTLTTEDSYVVDRLQQDIANLMSSVRLLQPLNKNQEVMVTDTLTSLLGELTTVNENTTAEAERALEIQHRYVQERNGGGLSLSKRQKGN